MSKRIISLFIFSLLLLSGFIKPASAHVSVKPNETGIAKFENFIVSVPVEKDLPTVELKLLLPEGLESVRPNVKSGWEIELKKENDEVKEIIWKNGNIPVNMRDEFIFSAKTPSQPTTLLWKAYQKYQDGTVVSWDQSSRENKSEENINSGPYSETKVINDLAVKDTSSTDLATKEESNQTLRDLGIYIALTLSILSLGFIIRDKFVKGK